MKLYFKFTGVEGRKAWKTLFFEVLSYLRTLTFRVCKQVFFEGSACLSMAYRSVDGSLDIVSGDVQFHMLRSRGASLLKLALKI